MEHEWVCKKRLCDVYMYVSPHAPTFNDVLPGRVKHMERGVLIIKARHSSLHQHPPPYPLFCPLTVFGIVLGNCNVRVPSIRIFHQSKFCLLINRFTKYPAYYKVNRVNRLLFHHEIKILFIPIIL